jgi:hypothetical protein
MEFLKGIISDELYAQLETALKDNKDVKLANLAKGEYVGKDKFDAQAETVKTMKAQVEEANKQIESFKGMDIDGIKKTADEYKAKFEQTQTEYDKKINDMQFGYALDSVLSGAKAKNATAVKALIDKDALKFVDGKIIGIDEQLAKIKTDNDFLFESTDPQPNFSKGGGGGQPPKIDSLRAAMGLPSEAK